METMSLVVDHNFDDQTLEELNTLREVRLGMAKKQLAAVEETIEQMHERGLLRRNSKRDYVVELREELTQKIAKLEERIYDKKSIFFDEIELYVGLLD